MELHNLTKRRRIGSVRKAGSFMSRLMGMLFCDPARSDSGLWLVPCRAVHTFGMGKPLDVIFLDHELRVVKTAGRVPPFSSGIFCSEAYSAVEFFTAACKLSGVSVGDQLEIR